MAFMGVERIPISVRKNKIKDLSETDLWNLILQIFTKLKFNWVDITHGINESGRDLVASAPTTTGGTELIAVVAKVTPISGGVSNSSTIGKVLDQVSLSFATSYSGPNLRNPTRINRVLVVTNKNISATAKSQISSITIPHGSIEFWQLEDLEKLVTDHVPSFYLNVKPELYDYLNNLMRECDRVKDIQRTIHFSKDKKLSDIFVVLPMMEIRRSKKIPIKGEKQKKKDKTKIFTDFTEPVQVELSDLLNPKKNYFLIGTAGSGKTCLLRQACITVAENILAGDSTLPIPIFLNARDLESSTELNLESVLEKTFFYNDLKLAIPTLLTEEYKYTLFVDGLDEMVDDENRSVLYDLLLDIANKNHNLKLIVTSRPLQMWREGPVGNIQETQILPINRLAMADLLSKLILKPQKTKAILRDLVRSEIFRKLPRTPLVVTLVALLHEEEELPEIPAHLSDLYDLFCVVCLERWTKKGMRNYDLKIAILELLALELHNSRRMEMKLSELFVIVRNYLEEKLGEATEYKIIATDLIKENVLLTCKPSNGNNGCTVNEHKICTEECSVSFIHKSFQEFFTARFLKRRPSEGEDFLGKNFDDPWWGALGMFFTGFIKDVPHLINEIIKTPPQGGPISFSRMINLGFLTQAATQTDLSIRVSACLHGSSLLKDSYDYCLEVNKKYNINMSQFNLVAGLCSFYEQAFSSSNLQPSLNKAFEELLCKFEEKDLDHNNKYLIGLQLLSIAWAQANVGEISPLLRLSQKLTTSEGVLTALTTVILESEEEQIKIDLTKKLPDSKIDEKQNYLKSIQRIKKRVKRNKDFLEKEMEKDAKLP